MNDVPVFRESRAMDSARMRNHCQQMLLNTQIQKLDSNFNHISLKLNTERKLVADTLIKIDPTSNRAFICPAGISKHQKETLLKLRRSVVPTMTLTEFDEKLRDFRQSTKTKKGKKSRPKVEKVPSIVRDRGTSLSATVQRYKGTMEAAFERAENDARRMHTAPLQKSTSSSTTSAQSQRSRSSSTTPMHDQTGKRSQTAGILSSRLPSSLISKESRQGKYDQDLPDLHRLLQSEKKRKHIDYVFLGTKTIHAPRKFNLKRRNTAGAVLFTPNNNSYLSTGNETTFDSRTAVERVRQMVEQWQSSPGFTYPKVDTDIL